jgi:type II secretory pathway pseudopilin PulG
MFRFSEIKKQEGQLLLEILIVIGVTAVIVGLSAQFIYLSLRGNKSANEKNAALGLMEETLEAVRDVSSEKWVTILNLTHGATNYYPQQSAGKWVLTSGSENIALNGLTFTRYFNVRHVCRNSGAITGISDTDGTATTCVSSTGSYDPSTEKITTTISWPNANPLVINEYLAGRWRNLVCKNTDWSTADPSNPVITNSSCAANNKYDSKDAAVDASTGSLKLQ